MIYAAFFDRVTGLSTYMMTANSETLNLNVTENETWRPVQMGTGIFEVAHLQNYEPHEELVDNYSQH